MLHVHLSNRVESLAESLLQRLDGPRDDPFAADTVIVPSLAVARWLTLRIADAHGVCAQVRFPFLGEWLWLRLREQLGAASPGLALTPPLLAWRLWHALAHADFVAAHPRLAAYLSGADAVMRFELAERSAALFDQVLTYRPQWIEAWSAGRELPLAHDEAGDQAWQAALWRRVAAELGLGRRHPLAALVSPAAVSGAVSAAALQPVLPPVLHLFALPALPPLHAELLTALASRCEVHVWALNPCREYWFELVSPKRFGRLPDAARLAHEVGHPLLAGWGRQTQACLDTLLDRAADATVEESYATLPGSSLLAQVHNSILELTTPGPGRLRLTEADRSIELHRCHSLTRELEVLHDRLLGLMHEAETSGTRLAPGSVLVVTPDLAAAAPLIDAVFGTVPPERFIPYQISGLPQRQGSAPARVLLVLLELLAGRAAASELFGLLQEPMVARRFGLAEEELALVQRWLIKAGLHGGLDAQQLTALDLGDDARHTLDDALERLLLGHLLPDAAPGPWAGRLGCGGAEGSAALALGALARYAQALQRLWRATRAPLPGARWAELLAAALDVFVDAGPAAGDDAAALRELRDEIGRWAAEQRDAGLGAEALLPLALVRHTLARRLDAPARGGVPGGGVTFAAMASLRQLPFEVIAAIGLDGSLFPAAERAADFDLLAAAPQRGDRQRRVDDRNLFLDLLLAARGTLHLSCTARSARDNSELNASVVIAELLDFLVDGLAPAAATAAERERWRARLVVDHPLQAFAHEPFLATTDPRARSHDAAMAQALRQAAEAAATPPIEPGSRPWETTDDDDHPAFDDDDDGEATADDDAADGSAADEDRGAWNAAHAAPFFAAPLPPAAAHETSLDELTRFFDNPARWLLRERLQLVLPRDEEALEDLAPALLETKDAQKLAQRLLPPLLDGADDDRLRELALAGPELPGGALGRHQLGEWLDGLRAFGERVLAASTAPALPPQPVDFDTTMHGERWLLSARLTALRSDGALHWRHGKLHERDQLRVWLAHLLLCLGVARDGIAAEPRSVHIASDKTLVFGPVAEPAPLLEALLRAFRDGHIAPLPFHLRSAAALIASQGDLERAAAVWIGSDYRAGERDDAARALAWRGVAEPLGAGFLACTQSIWEPLAAHARLLPPWQALPRSEP